MAFSWKKRSGWRLLGALLWLVTLPAYGSISASTSATPTPDLIPAELLEELSAPAQDPAETAFDGPRSPLQKSVSQAKTRVSGFDLDKTSHLYGNRRFKVEFTVRASLYLFDALGSPVNLVSPDGTVQQRTQYDAWGNVRAEVGESWNPFGFTGHELDDETGLYYARARFYDPEVGRFLSEDPFAGGTMKPPSLHKYLYAYQNPAVWVDPSGRSSEGLVEVADQGTREVLEIVQAAADEAARRHGLQSIEEVTSRGDLGTKVHATFQELLAPGGDFYHPRILTEVEVSRAGTIADFGVKGFAAEGSLVKDVVILREGVDGGMVTRGLTDAKSVTQLTVDLKLGKRGARLRQTETLQRMGVKSLTLRPHGSLLDEYAHVLDDLRLVRRAGRLARLLPGAVALFATVLTADEVIKLAKDGDAEAALRVMTGVDLLEVGVEALGEELEDTARSPAVERAMEADEEKARISSMIDEGS